MKGGGSRKEREVWREEKLLLSKLKKLPAVVMLKGKCYNKEMDRVKLFSEFDF